MIVRSPLFVISSSVDTFLSGRSFRTSVFLSMYYSSCNNHPPALSLICILFGFHFIIQGGIEGANPPKKSRKSMNPRLASTFGILTCIRKCRLCGRMPKQSKTRCILMNPTYYNTCPGFRVLHPLIEQLSIVSRDY